MILEYKEGYNWCSFNIDAVKLSTLFENIEKPINLYPNRDDSGLVVYTQKEAIIWQLENETVFGKLNASWSNDITLTHSEMYIIHFPKNTLLEISNDFIPEYLPITISKNIQWIGYHGEQNQQVNDALEFLKKPIETNNDNLVLHSQDINTVWNTESASWSDIFDLKHGSGYILQIPKNIELPQNFQYTYENLDSLVTFTFITSINTNEVNIGNKVLNKSIDTKTPVSVSMSHSSDKFLINGKITGDLYLQNKVYKIIMNNISNSDQKKYPMLILKDYEDISSILYTRITGDNYSFVEGIYYLDLRNYRIDVMYYKVIGLTSGKIIIA